MEKSNDPRYNFDANPTVDELIAQQGKGPIGDSRILLGDPWPGRRTQQVRPQGNATLKAAWSPSVPSVEQPNGG
jgi:hypothetical protein